jgi:NAD(P)-dependent dehydrogenase (short-subunit alcohol dehydrogenase family)
MPLLKDKVVVVTGAGHGIGRAHALYLSELGAKVVVNNRGASDGEGHDRPRAADEVVALIKQRGGQAVANHCDVASFVDAEALISQAVEEFGQLDGLVLNAGILRDRMIFNMAEDDWDDVVRVHLKGHFAPARHACAYWYECSKRDAPVKASVVCTSSNVGLFGNVGQTNYAAAKGGIAAFTIALANEMATYGVRANCIAPTANTRLIASIPGREVEVREPEAYDTWDPRNPGNISPVVAWLVSDLSSHVSGQVFGAVGATVTHYLPWRKGVKVEEPDSDRKWRPEELNTAINSLVFKSSHPGLRGGSECQPRS